MSETTPRPWNVQYVNVIYSTDGRRVSSISGSHSLAVCAANAELIVRAVNSHDLLLEAAEAAERFLTDPDASFKDYLLDQLRTAINAAKGN